MNAPDLKGRVALVTGANRGLGFETCRQLARAGATVILTARTVVKGEEATLGLAQEGLDTEFLRLDATDKESIAAAAAKVERGHGRLDLLINNAGGFYDQDQTAGRVDLGFARLVFELNLFGPWATTQAFLPLLRKSDRARVVMVSSGAGAHGDPDFGMGASASTPAYSTSKAALNALTVKLAAALKRDGILVNAVCPGFCATHPGMAEMGARPVAEGAAGIVWAAALPDGGPTGGFFRDGAAIAW